MGKAIDILAIIALIAGIAAPLVVAPFLVVGVVIVLVLRYLNRKEFL